MSHPPRPSILIILLVAALAGCSRNDHGGERPVDPASRSGNAVAGNEAVADKVRTAARALAQPGASVDFVAAELAGVVKARTASQTLIHYDGYRVIMTTPTDRVSRITFELADARPTMQQLSERLGSPKEIGRGYLYELQVEVTGSTIRILAEPASKPATESSLARRIIVEGAPTR